MRELYMKQVVVRTSTYSSDEFGVCSALYELGGMVVMHDASGCNSTYTTHDEPRWYDIDSMIYISAISEMEAIMGDDAKFIEDLIETANRMQPAFIALVGAPIPYMTGTDFPAIAKIVESSTGIPCFGFPTNGMEFYTTGISMALKELAERFCTDTVMLSDENPRVNILGATPLDFSVNGTVDAIQSWLSENGFEVNSCFAMGSSLEEIQKASAAQVNLVVSFGGLEAARVLEHRFGTPYVIGVPYGKEFSKVLAKKLHEALTSKNYVSGELNTTAAMSGSGRKQAVIIGESVTGVSLAMALELEHPELSCKVLCPVDTEKGLLREGDLQVSEEAALEAAMKKADLVIADPLYKMLCPGKKFISLPHTAFSGRIYEKEIPVLIGDLTPIEKEL